MPFRLSKLPCEVIVAILETYLPTIVQPPPEGKIFWPSDHAYYPEDSETEDTVEGPDHNLYEFLSGCCRVSRDWLQPGRLILYRFIYFHDTVYADNSNEWYRKKWELLGRTLCSRQGKKLGKMVRSLKFVTGYRVGRTEEMREIDAREDKEAVEFLATKILPFCPLLKTLKLFTRYDGDASGLLWRSLCRLGTERGGGEGDEPTLVEGAGLVTFRLGAGMVWSPDVLSDLSGDERDSASSHTSGETGDGSPRPQVHTSRVELQERINPDLDEEEPNWRTLITAPAWRNLSRLEFKRHVEGPFHIGIFRGFSPSDYRPLRIEASDREQHVVAAVHDRSDYADDEGLDRYELPNLGCMVYEDVWVDLGPDFFPTLPPSPLNKLRTLLLHNLTISVRVLLPFILHCGAGLSHIQISEVTIIDHEDLHLFLPEFSEVGRERIYVFDTIVQSCTDLQYFQVGCLKNKVPSEDGVVLFDTGRTSFLSNFESRHQRLQYLDLDPAMLGLPNFDDEGDGAEERNLIGFIRKRGRGGGRGSGGDGRGQVRGGSLKKISSKAGISDALMGRIRWGDLQRVAQEMGVELDLEPSD